MKETLKSITRRENIIRMIMSSVIFFAVALPFRELMSLMPGITEIRPANTIPPLLGIIWGVPAAFGIAFGNLISDITSGSEFFVCLTGFLANFLFAYLPYKLWYTFKVTEDDIRPVLGGVKKILKFIFIIFLDSLAVTAILTFIFETAGFSSSADSYMLLFYNNFDFAVIFGVPLLMLFEKIGIKYHIPKPSTKKRKDTKIPLIALLCVSITGFLYFLLSLTSGKPIRESITAVLLSISLLSAYMYIFVPYSFIVKEQHNAERKTKFSLKSKLVTGFLLVSVVFVAFIGFFAYNSSNNFSDELTHWMFVYQAVAIALNIVFAITILFLWYVEKNIVTPLEELSETAVEFADTDHNDGIQPEYIKITTGDEIEQLGGAFNQMMTDITDYVVNLKRVTAEKERIGAELSVATKIQSSMLPSIFPPFPNRDEFDIYAKMIPAKEVGGDFYDFFLIDETHLCVVIADVSGKGIPAALFMVIAKTLIKNSAQYGNSPAEIFNIVNNQLCEGNDAMMFVTAFAGILDIKTGQFIYVNAGHNPPLIKRKGDAFKWLETKAGFVLAGIEGIKYQQYETQISEGDMLFLYTDGVTEAMNKESELFSDQRLESCLNQYNSSNPKKIITSIKSDIDAFADGAEQADDITMLIVKIKDISNTSGFRELTVSASIENMDQVLEFATGDLKLDIKTQTQIQTAIEEIFVNIAHYAYAPETGEVVIRVKTESEMLIIELSDVGKAFNPLERPDPDITLPADKKSIGGLGIYMVKKTMDEVLYNRENDRNILTIKKRLRTVE